MLVFQNKESVESVCTSMDPRINEVTRARGKLCNEEIHTLHSLLHVILTLILLTWRKCQQIADGI